MVDLIITLLEYVAKLAGIHEGNRKEYFDRYVQPAYDAAELIYNDYRSMLQDLRREVEHSDTAEPIVRMLEKRRGDLVAARTRLRAVITERMNEGRATRFEAGVLGLMSGVVTSVDRPYFQTYGYAEAGGGLAPTLGRHTVLDILAQLDDREGDDISTMRQALLAAVDDKIQGIAEAWRTMVAGYAELHTGTLPPAGPSSRPRRRRVEQIAEVRSLLNEIYDMLGSGQYDRKVAIDFEKQVAKVLPELHPIAQEVRETVHDLDNEEPNTAVADLEACLTRFVQELDRVLRV